MKRWQKIIMGLILVLALFAGWVFYPQGVWPFVVSYPELEQLGEQYEVEILRDSYGVPHIFGQTDASAAFGLGYAHAEDDFLTIQQAFIAARGQLGKAYGIDAAPNDYMVQLVRIWDVLEAQYDTIPPEVQAVMQGYADGLNYYAALHPDEVVLPETFPVSGQDVAAGFMHRVPLFFGLDGVLGELFAEERQQPVSEKVTTQLPSTVRYGSNTIAVGPTRTANGETFFAINSHQPWEGIVAWYEAHIHSEEGWNAVGGLLPGSPTITHGHNEHLAWAFTVNSPDLIDVYVLEINPDNPDQYRFDDQWLDLEVRQAPITVNLAGRLNWTVNREILWSVYGPTVRQEHGVYAVRYAGWGEVGHVEQFLKLNKATDFAEWQTAVQSGPLPMFNIGYADETGNIYYVYNGLIPQRAEGYNWEQYLPGNTSETLWTEYVPFEQLPQLLNPTSGFVQNSNNSPFLTTLDPENPDPANFPEWMGINDTMSNRAWRSLELLGADEQISYEEFVTYKYDMGYTDHADIIQAIDLLLAEQPPTDPQQRQAYEILQAWDRQTTPDSTGASLAILMLHYLLEMETVDISVSNMTEGAFALANVQNSFEQAVDTLLTHFGQVDVAWSEVNRLQRGGIDLGLGGAPDVLHAIYGVLGEDGRFTGIAGDSYIMLVQWDAQGNLTSESIHQYGSATLDESSPHYADQAPIFVRRELTPVWFSEEAIRANLSQAYQPGQENRQAEDS